MHVHTLLSELFENKISFNGTCVVNCNTDY